MANEDLRAVATRAAKVVAEYRGKGLTEQDTKNAIIEPVLGALGWPKSDLTRVRAEYRQTSKSNPVDYALLSAGKPVLFLEAKALDKDIEEHKFVAQTLSYANVAGVDWAVITNGDQWDLFSVFARTAARDKRFFSTSVGSDEFVEWLSWLTPERLEGNDLESFWRLVVAERAVRTAVTDMFAGRDDDLVNLLVKRTRLDVADVATALQTVRPHFDAPAATALAEYVRTGAPVSPAVVASVAETPTDSAPAASSVGNDASHASVSRASKRRSSEKGRSTDGSSMAPPMSGMKPARLLVGAREYEVPSWRQLLLAAVRHVHETAPARLEAAFDADEFVGRKRRIFDRTADGMLGPAEIPGGFVETHLSASAIVKLASRLLVFAGEDIAACRYETREK